MLPDQLILIKDQRGESPWENANSSRSFREENQPLLPPAHWKERSMQRKLNKLEKKRLTGELFASTQRRSETDVLSPKAANDQQEGTRAHGLMDKSKHNLVFTRWLLDTFGSDGLRAEGRGVCDIAGGRGLISLELLLSCNIPSTLIEPKPLNLNSSYKKRVKKWLKKASGSDLSPATTHDCCLPLSCSSGGTDTESQQDAAASKRSLMSSIALSQEEGCGGTRRREESPAVFPLVHIQEEFHGIAQGSSSSAVIKAVTDCGVLLAMHPDQATGAVLEAALELQKPFAIVPCCVFSRQFPHRRTETGGTVSTYEELCDWIQTQDPEIKRATLPFHGRNTVLYRL